MEAALRWLASHTPASAELVRLLDATPVPCGQSAVTARRSDLYGWAGYGYCPSHSRWFWGAKLMLICTCEGTVTGFGLATRNWPRARPGPANAQSPARQPPGTRHRHRHREGPGRRGHRGVLRQPRPGPRRRSAPARRDEPPRYFPNWLRQRIEAIIWTLKNQLGLERHGGRAPAGLWARTVQRLLALNAVIWFNWQIGAPVKRSLIAYDH